MPVFASLLPGLRDVRTPMSVGVIWLGVGWIWFAEYVPAPGTSMGLWEHAYRLFAAFGPGLAITVVGFCGYLLGMLVGWMHLDWPLIRNHLRGRLKVVSWQSETLYRADEQSARMRTSHAKTEYEELLRAAGVVDGDYRLPGGLKIPADEQVSVESDIQLMAMRLAGTNSSIFDSYDRLISEAEFRRSVALPWAVIVGSVIVKVTGLSGIGWMGAGICTLALITVLHVLSWQKSREANDLIIQSMNGGLVKSPSVEALETQADAFENESGQVLRRLPSSD